MNKFKISMPIFKEFGGLIKIINSDIYVCVAFFSLTDAKGKLIDEAN